MSGARRRRLGLPPAARVIFNVRLSFRGCNFHGQSMKETKHQFLNVLAFTTVIFLIATGPASLAAGTGEKTNAAPTVRERLLMDSGWRFAFGHPTDVQKDFNSGTGYFSYLTKTGNGDGAAAANFDDRAWRMLDLPHDWAVEVPFEGPGSPSHGYKAMGRNFPDASVGWYRKSFFIPASDLGRRISVEFDGVFRDSIVWVNGHYLGREGSGYTSFGYNIGEFLNYGGTNVIAVRVDATMEEGWFYEGAGIYRHVWLAKTGPLHVARHGTFVTSELKKKSADVTARVTVVNEGTNAARFEIEQRVVDADGRTLGAARVKNASLKAGDTGEFTGVIDVAKPKLWSIETPYLHKLVTIIRSDDTVVDRYETPFGIRSIRFDPNLGFFLNGKHVELKGSNNHQDHAGVGAAIPDALQDFRIARLKTFGCNAYRCSHNPPTPEMLDACDRLGMLVLDENRLMGTSEDQLDHLKQMILRDRNHPCVIAWSLGNEEWGIENNDKGARIASTMQAFAKHLDPTRGTTVAISGGWGGGISTVIDIMGYNYISTKNTDQQHEKFPRQPGMGTEESTARGTRGIYFSDRTNGLLAAMLELPNDPNVSGGNMETGWKHYAARPYLAGLFYWTGFDYRGEPNPLGFPAVSSQFGILDTCGFPKYSFYYLKSWWMDEPMVHLFPHWNWPGKEGQEIDVTCFSNCGEVELFLNGRSLGRKTMEKNGHLEWKVKYEPGTLLARGYKDGQEIATDRVETTGDPAAIQLIPDRATIKADSEDVSIITVQVNDAQGRMMPTAGNEITFTLQGPGKIIGVGNGDPSSHKPDKYFDQISSVAVGHWRRHEVDGVENRPEVVFNFDDSGWPAAFGERGGDGNRGGDAFSHTNVNVYRGTFELPQNTNATTVALLLRSLGGEQSVYLNGQMVAQKIHRAEAGREITLDPSLLHPGTNVIAVVAAPVPGGQRGNREERVSRNPGLIKVTTAAGDWKRSVFNGLAQVIVQSTGQPGEITLTATSSGLLPGALKLQTQSALLRPAVAAR
jgi:beta-galactosidase